MAEENPAEVASAEVFDEFQVAEVEVAIGGKSSGSFDGGPVWVGVAVGTEVKGGGAAGFIKAES